MKQFTTLCRYCGKMIVMTFSGKDGRWVPCDPEIYRFRRSGGPFTYVNTEGVICRGERVNCRFTDTSAEYGYRRHRKDCANVRGNAV